MLSVNIIINNIFILFVELPCRDRVSIEIRNASLICYALELPTNVVRL